jgi:hypothetical protein
MRVSGSPRPRAQCAPMLLAARVLTGENPSDVPLRTIRMSWSDQLRAQRMKMECGNTRMREGYTHLW